MLVETRKKYNQGVGKNGKFFRVGKKIEYITVLQLFLIWSDKYAEVCYILFSWQLLLLGFSHLLAGETRGAKVKKVPGRHSREECQRLPAKEPTTPPTRPH